MKRKLLLKLSSFLVCLSVLLPGSAALAAEGEQMYFWEGLFPPERGQVSLLSIGNEAAIKADIKAALEARRPEVNLRSYNISLSDEHRQALFALYYDVLYENPGLFYAKTAITLGGNDVIFTEMDFSDSYAYTDAATINRNRALIEAEVNAILATIHPAMTDAEKALAVHDWFVLRYAYNTPASKQDELSEAHRIDGLFIDKTAVCQGYALGYIYVLQKLGIDAVYVPSDELNHAWNMVKLGGQWYHVDVTWDDPQEKESGADIFGYAGHNNFLRSDEGIIETDHCVCEEEIPETDHCHWDSPYKASADYANMFWKDITTGIFYTNGKWYYKNGTDIVSQVFTASSPTPVYTVTARWPVGDNSYYMGLFGIGVFNGRIYYNTATDIRSINLTGGDEKVHSTPELGNNQIYNMVILGNTLYMTIGASPNAEQSIIRQFIVSFPSAAGPADVCWLAWYRSGNLLGLQQVPFAANTAPVFVSANVEDATEVKSFVWGEGLAPRGKAIVH